MKPIAELQLDLSFSEEKVGVRIFAPEPDGENWFCRIEIDPPIDLTHKAYGASSMQALIIGLEMLSVDLYGSELYENKELGLYGLFGENLGIPATGPFLEAAPYPF